MIPRFGRDFILLWQGQAVSQIGSQAFLIATMYWVMENTGSATTMGVLMSLQTLPAIFLGAIAGTFADWYNRKHILIWTDAISGVAVLSLGVLLLTAPHQSGLLVAWLFGVTLITGIAKAFFGPAISASIPDLVPVDSIAAANSMRMFSGQTATILGQALGGIMYRAVGAPLLFLADGLSYLVSAFSESFIRLPHPVAPENTPPGAGRKRFVKDTLDGLRTLSKLPGATHLLLTAAAVNALVMPVIVLLPFYVRTQLGASAMWYGLLLGAFSAGSILGYVLVSTGAIRQSWRGTLLPASFVLAPAFLALLGQLEEPVFAAAAMAASGASAGLINIFVMTLFQTTAPPEMRGRVMSLVILVTSVASPIGMFAGGVLGDLTAQNTPLVFTLCGLSASAIALVSMANPGYRKILSG